MSDESIKTAQDTILDGTAKMLDDPSMQSSDALLGDMVQLLENAMGEGAALPDELIAQIDVMKNMQDQIGEIAALQQAGDHEAALAMSKQFAIDAGAPGADYEPNPPIFDAVEEGDIDALRAELLNWDVNAGHGKYACTLLYHALANTGFAPSFPIMHALLDAGADPKRGLGTDNGVLHAIGFGYYQSEHIDGLQGIIERCVALGADIEERTDHLGWTPLHTALSEWNEAGVAALLRAGADPNAACLPDAAGCTAGQTALEMVSSEPAMFALLLDHGADPDQACRDGADIRAVIQRHLTTAPEGDWAEGLAACLALLAQRKTQ